MTHIKTYWLAALAASAIIITGTSPATGAAEPGPEKATTTATEKVLRERGSGANAGAKRDTYPFRGKVASFDAAAQALKLEGKTTQRVVLLTAQTRLTKQGQPAVLEDLKPGEQVGGTLRKSPEGREEALLIRIGPKSEVPPAGTEPKPPLAQSQGPE
jgi:hypothetical protein